MNSKSTSAKVKSRQCTANFYGVTITYDFLPGVEAKGLYGRREDATPPVPDEIVIKTILSPSGDDLTALFEETGLYAQLETFLTEKDSHN